MDHSFIFAKELNGNLLGKDRSEVRLLNSADLFKIKEVNLTFNSKHASNID